MITTTPLLARFRARARPRATGPTLALATIAAIALASASGASTAAAAAPAKPLKVFILAGQSNMQGHAHVRTLDAMALSPSTAALLEQIRSPDGTPRVLEPVRVSSIGSGPTEQVGPLTVGFGAANGGPKIGPELTFGITMHRHLGEPILIIKTAWGGKSLHTDFRPPGAGPAELGASQREALERRGEDVARAVAERAEASGRFYRLMIEHVQGVLSDIERVVPGHDPAAGHELAGFVWFQGWNDMVDSGVYPRRGDSDGYAMYSDLLAQLIRDVRRDLSAPQLPFVIGVMGVAGPLETYGPEQRRHLAVHRNFREAMAEPATRPEFAGTVRAVPTAPHWDVEVAALRARERPVKEAADALRERMKAGDLARPAGNAAIERLYTDAFDARELMLLRQSTSNAEYHYLGSARIMAPIGAAFADAMAELLAIPPARPDAPNADAAPDVPNARETRP